MHIIYIYIYIYITHFRRRHVRLGCMCAHACAHACAHVCAHACARVSAYVGMRAPASTHTEIAYKCLEIAYSIFAFRNKLATERGDRKRQQKEATERDPPTPTHPHYLSRKIFAFRNELATERTFPTDHFL